MKCCIKCSFEGEDDLFTKNKNICKPCWCEYHKQWKIKKGIYHPRIKYDDKYHKEYQKKYRETHKEERREYVNNYVLKRRKNDEVYHLIDNIRSMIYGILVRPDGSRANKLYENINPCPYCKCRLT